MEWTSGHLAACLIVYAIVTLVQLQIADCRLGLAHLGAKCTQH